jgi:hypothetical protein
LPLLRGQGALHMRRRTSRAFSAVLLSVTTAWSVVDVAVARGSQYAFTRIAEMDSSDGEFLKASVNALGSVSFAGKPQGSVRGIYVGNGGPLTTITDVSDPRFVQFYHSEINNAGALVFGAGRAAGHNAVYVAPSDGTGLPRLIVQPDAEFFGPGGVASINDSGLVAFSAFTHTQVVGIYTMRSPRGPRNTIVTSATLSVIGGHNAVNAKGQVVLEGTFPNGVRAVLVGSGGPLTTIADTSGGAFTNVGSPDINDASRVTFIARRSDGQYGVYKGGGPSAPILIADTAGAFSSFVDPAINENDQVAFMAFLDSGGTGVFTGPDPVADRVIGTGDVVLGRTVAEVWFGFRNLNDAGSIAFWTRFADGTSAILRADPVPEPGLLVFGAVAFLLAAGRHRRRRRGRT